MILSSTWVLDLHYHCVNADYYCSEGTTVIHLPLITDSLPVYLSFFGFEIPSSISYCLAESDRFTLKYRRSGGLIKIYISIKN